VKEVWALLGAWALALGGVPVLRWLALRMGFLDQPDDGRKDQARPVPLLGGPAMFLAAVVALLLAHGRGLPESVRGSMLAGALVALLGLLDDHRPLSAWLRLAVQAGAGVLLVVHGVQVRLDFLPAAGNLALTLFWVLAITNAMNLLDNMDGLSAGVAAIASAWMVLLGVWNAQPLVAPVAAALLGACLGFLRYNLPPARIYMGDSGAYFLGFFLALLSLQLRFRGQDEAATWAVPLLLLAVPLLDTGLVVVSRLRRGVHPFTPGRDHLSHRLVRLGLDKPRAVQVLWAAGALSGAVGILVSRLEPAAALLLAGAWTLLAGAAGVWLERGFIRDDGLGALGQGGREGHHPDSWNRPTAG